MCVWYFLIVYPLVGSQPFELSWMMPFLNHFPPPSFRSCFSFQQIQKMCLHFVGRNRFKHSWARWTIELTFRIKFDFRSAWLCVCDTIAYGMRFMHFIFVVALHFFLSRVYTDTFASIYEAHIPKRRITHTFSPETNTWNGIIAIEKLLIVYNADTTHTRFTEQRVITTWTLFGTEIVIVHRRKICAFSTVKQIAFCKVFHRWVLIQRVSNIWIVKSL